MARITLACLRYADRANKQCKGNKQCCPIILHEQILPFQLSRHQTANSAFLRAGAPVAIFLLAGFPAAIRL
jgi:hypothetical protein